MFIALFLGFTIIAIYYTVNFHGALNKASSVWQTENTIKVFGSSFKSSTEMYADFSFLNNLWIGKNMNSIPIDELRIQLTCARKYLRYQVLSGFSAFFSVVANGVAIA